MADESSSLLQQYVRQRSQAAFAEIVRRYVDIVYASARRQVRDADLAQDVTQAVFVVLSQKANKVPTERPLSAWLLTTTRYVAANARRAREHRELHERRAAQMARDIHNARREEQGDFDELLPLLDEGLSKLGAGERDALVLKYFEKKSLRQVGEILGISEEAATKRVSRAVERLRGFFQRRGATVSAVGVTTFLMSEAAQAAPLGLAASISAGASASAATMAHGAIALMAAQKAKALVAVAAALLVGAGAVVIAVTSLSRASGPRQVAFSPARNIASTTAGMNAKWQVTFSDGSTVELLGINNIGSTQPTWWAPDGSPASRPPLRRLNGGAVTPGPGQVRRQMVFRLTTTSPAAKRLNVQLPATQQITISTMSSGQQTLVNCLMAVPRELTTATVTLELTSGGWREAAELRDVSLIPAAAQPVATGN